MSFLRLAGEGVRRLIGLLGLGERRCLWCAAPLDPDAAPELADSPLCPECRAAMPRWTGLRCPKCAEPMPPEPHLPRRPDVICARCRTDPPPWAGVACHGLYEGELRLLLRQFKFSGRFRLAEVAGRMLADAAAGLPRPDAAAAIPMHPARLRERGYNQAHEAALVLGRLTGTPVRADLLARPVAGPPQSSLSAAERRKMRDVHAASPEVRGMRLWLVDDILTTGSTARAAANTLIRAGAARVDVLVVARTPPPDAATAPEGRPLERLSPQGAPSCQARAPSA